MTKIERARVDNLKNELYWIKDVVDTIGKNARTRTTWNGVKMSDDDTLTKISIMCEKYTDIAIEKINIYKDI